MEMQPDLQKKHMLNCLVQDVHVCIDMEYVNNILPIMSVEPVPNSPAYVVGLANIEGVAVPIIDLAMRLGKDRTKPYNLDIPLLLCSDGKHQAGFIVDTVIMIAEVDGNDIQASEQFDAQTSAFNGSVSIKNNLSLLVNMQHLLPVSLYNETTGAEHA